MKVKICGITNIEDALVAAGSGAGMLGFIFVKSSQRYIDPDSARQIISRLPSNIETVGVFADSPKNDILKVAEQTGIGYLQFHGAETPQEISKYSIPVIKSFRVKNNFDLSILRQYTASAFLLDTFVDGTLGGTGKTFDWKIAVEAKSYGRIILAGGLNPDNIAGAVSIVKPYAVDVNSGVESSPGKKDKQKLQKLFRIIRQLENGSI